ncbi:MAG: phosphoribosylformylglycinamidine synthase subunit PurS [Candidatus Kapabacteria bacterium]|nr:phosphoribosylformylglycinamidine synthase subunit PurS [Candidatus Kapabacteria bacterium]
MKTYTASITVTLRRAILDVQGKAVEHALHSLHMPALGNVRIGKHIELDVQAPDKETAHGLVMDACSKLLSNPVMEDFSVHIMEKASGVPA